MKSREPSADSVARPRSCNLLLLRKSTQPDQGRRGQCTEWKAHKFWRGQEALRVGRNMRADDVEEQ